MNRLCFLLSLLCFSISYSQNWQSLPNFPGVPRDDGTGFILNDIAYFGSGLSPWWSEEADFYGLDLNSETWVTISSLPLDKERQYATGFSSTDGRGFIFGGVNGTNYLNDLLQYDPITDMWTELTALPSTGRSGMACIVINDTAYIVGGKTATNQAINEVWAYCMSTNVWTQKNDFPFGNRWRASATSMNGKGYLIFGKDESSIFHNSFYVYEPEIDSWNPITPFPAYGRSHASLTSINNELYVCFGIDSLGNSHNDVWKYNSVTSSWTNLPGLPDLGRRGGIGLSWQNSIYYTTGIDESDTRLNETWKFVFDLDIEAQKVDQSKKLIRVVDIMGRETEIKPNVLLLFMDEDGSTEKVIVTE